MSKVLKKYWKQVLLLGFFIVIIIPVIVYVITVIPIFPAGGNNDWAGFWGGYFGSLVGGLITLYVLHITIRNEKNLKRREEKINFFNDLIHLTAEMSSLLGNISIFMSRGAVENTNDLHEKVLLLGNEIAKLFIEIKLLLKTRKSVYSVEILIDILEKIEEIETRIVENYESAVKINFIQESYIREIELLEKQLQNRLNDFENTLNHIVSCSLQ